MMNEFWISYVQSLSQAGKSMDSPHLKRFDSYKLNQTRNKSLQKEFSAKSPFSEQGTESPEYYYHDYIFLLP